MSQLRLPQELVDAIVDCVHPRSLYSCASASKAFLAPCRQRIFRSISPSHDELPSTLSIERVHSALIRTPHISPYIRNVTVWVHTLFQADNPSDSHLQFEAILRALTHIECLVLRGVPNGIQKPMSAFSSTGSLSSTWSHLRSENPCADPPRLENLIFSDTHDLDPPNHVALDFLITENYLSRLRSLVHDMTVDLGWQAYRLLKHAAPTLLHLKIYNGDTYQERLTADLKLPALLALQSLELQIALTEDQSLPPDLCPSHSPSRDPTFHAFVAAIGAQLPALWGTPPSLVPWCYSTEV
ncbi:hypothetical protein C8R44DRAFT_725828 [Mycena epipterygia]|nr:hypothetical protein C8R44DRAFT_725828 [Mycena epipterygia]